MPFSIRKVGKNKYQVYNTATGEIHSKGTTKKKAEGQFRLLQGIARNEVIDLEGGMNKRSWADTPRPRFHGTLPPIPDAPRTTLRTTPAQKPRFYTELAKGVVEKNPPVKKELDSAIRSLNDERRKVHRDFWELEKTYKSAPDIEQRTAIKKELDRLGNVDFQLENDSTELQKIITEMGSLTASGRRRGGANKRSYIGGAKRSRSPPNWQQERQRLIGRLNDLDARNNALRQEQDNLVRDETPELPEALLGNNPHNPDEDFETKIEIVSEYINSEREDRDFDFPALEEQGLLQDALRWVETIPHNVIQSYISRDIRRDALIRQIEQIEEDIADLDETAVRENTLGEEDSGTEMEGYGYYSIPSQEYQPRRFL